MQALVSVAVLLALIATVTGLIGVTVQALRHRPKRPWVMLAAVSFLVAFGTVVVLGATGSATLALIVVAVAGVGAYVARNRHESAAILGALRDTIPKRSGGGSSEAEKEHGVRIRRAEGESRRAEKEHKTRVKAAEKELRFSVTAREKRIKKAEADLQKTRQQAGLHLDTYRGEGGADVHLFADRVTTSEGEASFKDGPVTATVDTAGNLAVTRRGTITRTLLLGGIGGMIFKKEERHDARELYLLIETPNFASLIQCKPDDGPKVRQLAVRINNTSRAYASTLEAHEKDVARAEEEVRLQEADRAAVEEAETRLMAAEADTTRLDAARAEADRVRAEGESGSSA